MHLKCYFRCIFNVCFICKVNSQHLFIFFSYLSNPPNKDGIIETFLKILLTEGVEFLSSFCTYQYADTLTRPIIGEAIHPLVISQDNIADATEKSS